MPVFGRFRTSVPATFDPWILDWIIIIFHTPSYFALVGHSSGYCVKIRYSTLRVHIGISLMFFEIPWWYVEIQLSFKGTYLFLCIIVIAVQMDPYHSSEPLFVQIASCGKVNMEVFFRNHRKLDKIMFLLNIPLHIFIKPIPYLAFQFD